MSPDIQIFVQPNLKSCIQIDNCLSPEYCHTSYKIILNDDDHLRVGVCVYSYAKQSAIMFP
jgi:hypothetical protein